jgi:transcriptional regulator with XRE-family HTH domain
MENGADQVTSTLDHLAPAVPPPGKAFRRDVGHTVFSRPTDVHRSQIQASERTASELTLARRRVGLSVTDLARRVHVSRPSVSMWEKGARRAGRAYWPALGAALELSLDQVAALFHGYPPSRYDRLRLPSLAPTRRASGRTQRDLAAEVGVAASSLSTWEGGAAVPAVHARALARALGTDVTRLSEPPPREVAVEPDLRPLRRLRRDAGMSQREAAALLGIAIGTLARYESGERSTPVPVVRAMARSYRRPVREVLQHGGVALVPLPTAAVWSPEVRPQAIRALRTTEGLSKEGLGRLIGRSGQAIRRWEDGAGLPDAASVRRLEVVFRLPPGKLGR